MLVMDAPPTAPPVEVNAVCIVYASAYYSIPPEVMLMLRMVEGGKPGTVSRNKNGTYDYGPNQINTINVRKFEKYGMTREVLTHNECWNTIAAAALLQSHTAERRGNTWEALGDYHSRTPKFRNRYLGKMRIAWQLLQGRYGPYCQWLRANTERLQAAWRGQQYQ